TESPKADSEAIKGRRFMVLDSLKLSKKFSKDNEVNQQQTGTVEW
ncbi:MAG: hypothetical protein RLZZ490_2362, partial [Cyanobacteriota bacterium]